MLYFFGSLTTWNYSKNMSQPLLLLLIALGLVFLSLLLFAPHQGLLHRWRRARIMTDRVRLEDALKHLGRSATHGRPSTLQSLAGALDINVNQAAEIVAQLQARELLSIEDGEFRLTPQGWDYALRIIRAHRLWEEHLAEETGFAEADWHDQAEYYEHQLSPEDAQSLAAQLGNPTHDPHGDPIPTSGGEFQPYPGQPLAAMPLDRPLRIVHIEDEPEAVYAQLVAEGLFPGMTAYLLENAPQRVRLWAGGDEHVLAPVVAANITAVALAARPEGELVTGIPLSQLRMGERGRVIELSPRFRGAERRRLLDLGILPGTLISAELVSPSGDPTAYRVRDALIALRAEQARHIRVAQTTEVLSA